MSTTTPDSCDLARQCYACPFCGQPERFGVDPDHIILDVYMYAVVCGECGAKGPTSNSKEEAIAKWNSQVDGGHRQRRRRQ